MSATNLREKPEQFIAVEEDLSLSPVSLSWSDGHRVGIVIPLHLPSLCPLSTLYSSFVLLLHLLMNKKLPFWLTVKIKLD